MGVRGPQERFEAKVDRSGEHHLWRGAKKVDGTGQVRVGGQLLTAHRAAWQLEHGPIAPGQRVQACPAEPACVRLEHLSLTGIPSTVSPITRARRGSGSLRELRPGVWELSITAGRYTDGGVRRLYRTVEAPNRTEALSELSAFVAEATTAAPSKAVHDITLDAAVEQFLTEHLAGEKGRTDKTVNDYRKLHTRWFSPEIGSVPVRAIEPAAIDRIFGRMRRAGLSRSRMNQARSLYAPFFRWAKSRRMVARSPMADFELPTSNQISKERVPPEIGELSLLLSEAVIVIPDVAPLLALGAVTGMRRGELVAVRRSGLRDNDLVVATSIDEGRRVKTTKTRRERRVSLDAATVGMLQRHCELMDERAALFGVPVPEDAYVFSNAPDCSAPMPPDYATRRVAELKEHLGIANKRPHTIALEDEALRLYRSTAKVRVGVTGPAPKGGLSYREIGERVGRSERWASLAVAAAERREQAATRGLGLDFDGSIVALRKFTSSELLDAGFNISMVAQRQGHGPQVLMKHYSKSRKSADRKAAEHLGRVVHGES